MFCDMEGFTPFTEKLGPEDAFSIMDEVYEILIHKVHDYEGTVNEMTGDGIMALFGAPIAMEDAPQRAIRSAMAIHREMAKFNDKLKQEREDLPTLKMRTGIHTGPVVVGTLGNDLRVEFKAVGDTVNLASRMEGLAEPGTTFVTEETFKLTEGLFRFEALGEMKVKGKEKLVKVYQAIAPSTRRTRFDVSAERGLTPFVGRERELELLLDGFERARGGRGQAFSIMAEAGVGKSRLLYEFRKALVNEEVTFIEGRCLSYSRDVAYHPVIDTLKSSFNIQDDDGDLEIREKVKKGLKALAVDEASTLPYLLELLSIKDSGMDELSLSPEDRKYRIIEALNRSVLRGSEMRPLVMVIEDIHWIDNSSEERFKSLLDCISGARVFLIFTYRPDFVHTWGGRSYHSQVTLNRLSNRESLSMVSYLLGTEDNDRELEELILEKTEGVPFFIEELLKSLHDLKVIERKDNKYYLAKNIKDLIIPSTIQDMIMARVDALPEVAKGLLQTGSVVGREFSQSLIEKMTDISERELLSHLSVLKDSELLYERGIYPQSTYIFKHALIQDAAYLSLLKSTRQKYHRKIAEVLEKHFSDTGEEQPELLAHHYTEARCHKEAARYWQWAGERASARSAYVEAIAHHRKGLEVLKTNPEATDHAELELALQFDLASSLIVSKGHTSSEVEGAYVKAYELCQQVGETPTLIPVLQGLRRLYALRGDRGDGQRARELGEQLLTLAQRRQDTALLQEAHWALGQTLYHFGELNPAHTHLEQSSAFYTPQPLNSQPSRDAAGTQIACLFVTGWALWLLGYPDKALETGNEALSLAHELSHPFTLGFAFFSMAKLNQFRREFKATLKQAEAVLTLSNEHGFPLYVEFGTLLRGWTLAMQGNPEEGVAQMRQVIVTKRIDIVNVEKPLIYALLVEAYGAVGQAEEGLNIVAEALDVIEQTGFRNYEAELHRLQGEMLLKQTTPESARAESCFQRALDLSRTHQAKSVELRASMSMSRLWKQQGKRKEARMLLGEIYGWFNEGFDTADLKEAKVLLEKLA
jgi:class 3 adenylate cyclase/predicted ATPase